jgi:O-antigen/teichoic acid export membrane protein
MLSKMFGLRMKKSAPGIRRNAVWNCMGTLSEALIGFIMMPFLVHTLGNTTYGLWALIGSLTGCFGFLDLGVRGALGRQLAFHLARRDARHVNATLNTALVLLCAACAVTLAGVVALQFLFFRLFEVPADQQWTVRVTLFLSGLNLALFFPLGAFDATLWAAQRFDRLNQIDVSANVLKSVAILVFLTSPATLICLPLISLVGSLASGVLKMIVTWSAFDALLTTSPPPHGQLSAPHGAPQQDAERESGLRFGFRYVSRTAFGDIFAYGLWNFLLSVVRLVVSRIPAVVIGSFMGPAAVTPYSIAEKLLNVINSLFLAATGVLTPKSAVYSALDDSSRQRALFVQGGRTCWAMAVFVGLGMCFFGHPLITAWLGPKYGQAAVYLAIIALGSIVPLSQSLTGCVLLGIARHQYLAVIAIGQTLLAIVLALLAAVHGGATAVCAALAIVSTFAGLTTAWHGCGVLRVRLSDYAREAVVPALAASFVPAMLGAVMYISGASLFAYEFVAQIILYSLLFAASYYRLCWRPSGIFTEVRVRESE